MSEIDKLSLLLAIGVVIWAAWVLGNLLAFAAVIRDEAALFRMGCHPRQKQLQRKWERTRHG